MAGLLILTCHQLEGFGLLRGASVWGLFLLGVVFFISQPRAGPIAKALFTERLIRLFLGSVITLAHLLFCILSPDNKWPVLFWWVGSMLSLIACFYLAFFRLVTGKVE